MAPAAVRPARRRRVRKGKEGGRGEEREGGGSNSGRTELRALRRERSQAENRSWALPASLSRSTTPLFHLTFVVLSYNLGGAVRLRSSFTLTSKVSNYNDGIWSRCDRMRRRQRHARPGRAPAQRQGGRRGQHPLHLRRRGREVRQKCCHPERRGRY